MFKYYSNHRLPVSPFWATITKLECIGQMSIKYEPGMQTKVLFWQDLWLDNCTLATRFPALYRVCIKKNVTLGDIIYSQGQCVRFKDVLIGVKQQEWGTILHIISQISFTHLNDKLAWRWENTGKYSVKSLYTQSSRCDALLPYAMVDPTNTSKDPNFYVATQC